MDFLFPPVERVKRMRHMSYGCGGVLLFGKPENTFFSCQDCNKKLTKKKSSHHVSLAKGQVRGGTSTLWILVDLPYYILQCTAGISK